jgi:hypothetical protein
MFERSREALTEVALACHRDLGLLALLLEVRVHACLAAALEVSLLLLQEADGALLRAITQRCRAQPLLALHLAHEHRVPRYLTGERCMHSAKIRATVHSCSPTNTQGADASWHQITAERDVVHDTAT